MTIVSSHHYAVYILYTSLLPRVMERGCSLFLNMMCVTCPALVPVPSAHFLPAGSAWAVRWWCFNSTMWTSENTIFQRSYSTCSAFLTFSFMFMYLKGYTVISNTYFAFRETKKDIYILKRKPYSIYRSFKIYLCAHAENIIQGDMHDVHTADAAAI